MPLGLPGAVAGGASLAWWEGEREGVGLAPPRQAGGAMATILEKLHTEWLPRRSDGHDLREMTLGIAFEAARWPRSSRNCTQNGFRGSAMATIFGRCHTELPPSLQDALGEGHELPGLGSLPENPKIEPVHRKIKLTITLIGIRTQNLHFLGGGLRPTSHSI